MQFSQMGNLKELFIAGGPVLILLIILSIYSISIMIDRFLRYKSKINKSRKLMDYVRYQLPARNFGKIIDACRKGGYSDTPAAKLVLNLLKSDKTDLAELNDLANSIIDWEIAQLSRKLSVLATLASTTPFIGLFGTVLGVMRAFADLASISGAGAGPSVVAKGIAEALVNTAAGLFVAVPALIAYNYFLSKLNFFTKNMDYMAQEVISAKTYKDPSGKDGQNAAQPQNIFGDNIQDLVSAGRL
ncbi:MAG: MotA/TolQ/ExbB proton channel family protein [Elusimicrobiota bacterium]|jgi:biopolymer transport protein ExbB/TolQ|nr:MotA/TolQ/ExbB proton channel family protein [Elusimicrobiota bacterium]